MIAGNLVAGQLGSRARAAGLGPFVVPVAGVMGMLIVQIALIFQPAHFWMVAPLWLVLAFCGSAAPIGFVALGQMFPREQTARVSTAVNTITLGGAFLLQAMVGWILDLWPRTESGGWHPDGYSWALAVSALIHALSAYAMLRPPLPTDSSSAKAP
jgi:hypothetical protein